MKKVLFIDRDGTMILDTKIIDRVLQNLSHPPEEPEYRKNRKHSDFLTSLPRDFSISQFKLDLHKIFLEYLENTLLVVLTSRMCSPLWNL